MAINLKSAVYWCQVINFHRLFVSPVTAKTFWEWWAIMSHTSRNGGTHLKQEICCMMSQTSSRQVLPNCRWRTAHQETTTLFPMGFDTYFWIRKIFCQETGARRVKSYYKGHWLGNRILKNIISNMKNYLFQESDANNKKGDKEKEMENIRKKNLKGNVLGCYNGKTQV